MSKEPKLPPGSAPIYTHSKKYMEDYKKEMKERKTPECVTDAIIDDIYLKHLHEDNRECCGVRFDHIAAMREYGEIARQEGYKAGEKNGIKHGTKYAYIAQQNARQEGYEKGRTEGESRGKRQVKTTVDNITPEGLVETAKADGFADGYRLGVKEERERHAKLVSFVRNLPAMPFEEEKIANEALKSAGYLGKEEA